MVCTGAAMNRWTLSFRPMYKMMARTAAWPAEGQYTNCLYGPRRETRYTCASGVCLINWIIWQIIIEMICQIILYVYKQFTSSGNSVLVKRPSDNGRQSGCGLNHAQFQPSISGNNIFSSCEKFCHIQSEWSSFDSQGHRDHRDRQTDRQPQTHTHIHEHEKKHHPITN